MKVFRPIQTSRKQAFRRHQLSLLDLTTVFFFPAQSLLTWRCKLFRRLHNREISIALASHRPKLVTRTHTEFWQNPIKPSTTFTSLYPKSLRPAERRWYKVRYKIMQHFLSVLGFYEILITSDEAVINIIPVGLNDSSHYTTYFSEAKFVDLGMRLWYYPMTQKDLGERWNL